MATIQSSKFAEITVGEAGSEYVACEFVNCTVRMDGCRFAGCEFTDCTLQFAGTAPWDIQGCQMNGFRCELVGAHRITLGQLRGIFHGLPDGRPFVESIFDAVRRK